MHFWIDKRSPYGFGRGARVSGSGFGQYPRRLRPSKPWSQNNRHAATTPTSIDRNSYPGSHGDHQATAAAAAGAEPSDASASSSPSYCKWSLWAIAIGLSSLLVYIICAKLYNEHQLFTFCALLAVFFILGVCTVSNMFRRTAAQPLAAGNAPQVLRQESSSSSSRTTSVTAPAAGPAIGHPHQSQQQHPHHNHHHHHHNHHNHQNHHSNNNQHSNYVPDNRSPSISIHNLAESPTPTYHNSHNQYSPPPYHIALEMHFPDYVKSCDEMSLPPYDKIEEQQQQQQHHQIQPQPLQPSVVQQHQSQVE